MIVHFKDLFDTTEEGILRPKVVIQLVDLGLTPKAHPPLETLQIDGIPLPKLKDELLEVDIEYDRIVVFIIKKLVR